MMWKKEQPVEDPASDRAGTWADTGYNASDEEAHRDITYTGSTSIRRMGNVFMCQMKLFSKNKWTFLMMFAAVLIPIVLLAVPEMNDIVKESSAGSTAYIGYVLCLMGFMASFFTAFMCGTQIPSEFKERTAYMSMPLPMTRTEFYLGKFLAGFVLCLGIFLMAFGFAVVMAMKEFDAFFADDILNALLGTIVMIFAYSATAYCLGSFMKKGAAIVPLLLMYFVLPLIVILVSLKFDVEQIYLLPCFLPDVIIDTLGSTNMSIPGMMSALGISGIDYGSKHIELMLSVGAIWAIGFLLAGWLRIKRREM